MRLTIQAGTMTKYENGSEITENIYYQNVDELMKEFEKQKSEFKNPNVTEDEIMKFAEKSQDSKRIQKLGQYEDIEEELGISLVTLFKALDKKQRIFVLNEYDMRVVELPVRYASRKLVDGEIFINVSGCFANFKIKDYGKWWALTKEELL